MFASVAGERHEIPDMGLMGAVLFERHFGLSATVLEPEPLHEGATEEETREHVAEAKKNLRVEWIGFLLYQGLLKLEVFPRGTTFDQGLAQIEDFDLEDDEDEEEGGEGKV